MDNVQGGMGCTPSKSKATYTQDKVWRDFDTCSTFVSGFKSSVSTPERTTPGRPIPGPCPGRTGGKENLLNVPTHDYHGHNPSRTVSPEGWSSYSSHSKSWCGTKPSISDSDSSDNETPHGHQQ